MRLVELGLRKQQKEVQNMDITLLWVWPRRQYSLKKKKECFECLIPNKQDIIRAET